MREREQPECSRRWRAVPKAEVCSTVRLGEQAGTSWAQRFSAPSGTDGKGLSVRLRRWHGRVGQRCIANERLVRRLLPCGLLLPNCSHHGARAVHQGLVLPDRVVDADHLSRWHLWRGERADVGGRVLALPRGLMVRVCQSNPTCTHAQPLSRALICGRLSIWPRCSAGIEIPCETGYYAQMSLPAEQRTDQSSCKPCPTYATALQTQHLILGC